MWNSSNQYYSVPQFITGTKIERPSAIQSLDPLASSSAGSAKHNGVSRNNALPQQNQYHTQLPPAPAQNMQQFMSSSRSLLALEGHTIVNPNRKRQSNQNFVKVILSQNPGAGDEPKNTGGAVGENTEILVRQGSGRVLPDPVGMSIKVEEKGGSASKELTSRAKNQAMSLPPATQSSTDALRNFQIPMTKTIKEKNMKRQLAAITGVGYGGHSGSSGNVKRRNVFNHAGFQSQVPGINPGPFPLGRGNKDLTQIIGQRKSIEQIVIPQKPRSIRNTNLENTMKNEGVDGAQQSRTEEATQQLGDLKMEAQ